MEDHSNSAHSQKKDISLHTAGEVDRIDNRNDDCNDAYDDIKKSDHRTPSYRYTYPIRMHDDRWSNHWLARYLELMMGI
jgi:hypothetical protein